MRFPSPPGRSRRKGRKGFARFRREPRKNCGISRARENQGFLLAANDCSRQVYDNEGKGAREIQFAGQSRGVDPYGRVLVTLASAKQPFSHVSVILDATLLESVKTLYGPNTDPMRSRRPECYAWLTQMDSGR